MPRLLETLRYALRRKTLGERHRPSGLNQGFTPADGIDAYITAATGMIEAARVFTAGQERASVIAGNAPFMLRPHPQRERGAALLMVHGLTDSPFVTRDLAAYFQDQGFSVLSLLLPGHGSRPGDLLGARWQDWVRAHRWAVDCLARSHDSVYLCGFSLGAALNLYQALTDERICGLFLFSPAFRVHPAASISCAFQWLGQRLPALRWLDVQPDDDAFKYESVATNAVCQAVTLERRVRQLHALRPLRVPLFIGASEDDATVVSSAALALFGKADTRHKRMLYYSRRQPGVPAGVRLIHSVMPDKRIISSAHTAMIVSPANPHYGEAGDYAFCAHYYRGDPARYARCKAFDEDALGEMGLEGGGVRVVRRLTWNPWYNELLGELDRFIEKLP